MTCFTRHLKDLFGEIGVEMNPESKRRVQNELTEIVNPESKKCWDVWKGTKRYLADDKKKKLLIKELKKRWTKN